MKKTQMAHVKANACDYTLVVEVEGVRIKAVEEQFLSHWWMMEDGSNY